MSISLIEPHLLSALAERQCTVGVGGRVSAASGGTLRPRAVSEGCDFEVPDRQAAGRQLLEVVISLQTRYLRGGWHLSEHLSDPHLSDPIAVPDLLSLE